MTDREERRIASERSRPRDGASLLSYGNCVAAWECAETLSRQHLFTQPHKTGLVLLLPLDQLDHPRHHQRAVHLGVAASEAQGKVPVEPSEQQHSFIAAVVVMRSTIPVVQ
jgi:hypothetical protein